MADTPNIREQINDAGKELPESLFNSDSSLDFGVIFGLVIGLGSVLGGLLLEGGQLGSYVVISAFLIVFGGTFGATMTSIGLSGIKNMPLAAWEVIKHQGISRGAVIRRLMHFAERARREGLLVLEDDLEHVDHEFMRKGIQLVVDGTDPELVKDILQTEVDSTAEVFEKKAGSWNTAGGFSPTLGIIGTVMGLVLVLQNLSDPGSLGPAIAVAFVATWYGVSFANLIYLPIGLRIKSVSEEEVTSMELMIEGIMSIQAGDNPRILEEKLLSFISAEERMEYRLLQEITSAKDVDLAA